MCYIIYTFYMYIFFSVLLRFIICMALQMIAKGQETIAQKLFPWISSSGLIGFAIGTIVFNSAVHNFLLRFDAYFRL